MSASRVRRVLATLLVAEVWALAGCGIGPTPMGSAARPPEAGSPRPVLTSGAASSSPSARPTASRGHGRPASSRTLTAVFPAASFSALAGRLGRDPLGIAVVALDGHAFGTGESLQYGDWTGGDAWSTAKIPVVMAAVGHTKRPSPRLDRLARRAITVSDNAAAMSLWSTLGSASAAGVQVQRELRSNGDPNTRIQDRAVRTGFTPFGQTQWNLRDQASFAARLPCAADQRPVLRLMGQISSGQRWGLGRLGSPGAVAFKGGWGPESDSSYLVRQIGVFQTSDGKTWGIAVGVLAGGGFVSGTDSLGAVADWVRQRLRTAGLELRRDGPRCRS